MAQQLLQPAWKSNFAPSYNVHVSSHFINHSSTLYTSFSVATIWEMSGSNISPKPNSKMKKGESSEEQCFKTREIRTVNDKLPQPKVKTHSPSPIAQEYISSYYKNIDAMYLDYMENNYPLLIICSDNSVPGSGICVNNVRKEVIRQGKPCEPSRFTNVFLGYWVDFHVFGFHKDESISHDEKYVRDLYSFVCAAEENGNYPGWDLDMEWKIRPFCSFKSKRKYYCGYGTTRILDSIVEEMKIEEIAEILIKVKDAYKNPKYYPDYDLDEDDMILFHVEKMHEQEFKTEDENIWLGELINFYQFVEDDP